MNVPAKVPFEVGLKTMLLLQLAPAASVVPHPKAEIAKGDEAPAPFTVMAELVPLVRTRVCGELVVPTACEPKFRLAGESVTPVVELAPVPVREVDCVPAESVTARLPVRSMHAEDHECRGQGQQERSGCSSLDVFLH